MDRPKLKKKIRKIRLRTIFLLAITLASNSFAWFIYTTKVSSNITAKVREWNVTFDVNGQQVEQIIQLNIDSLFPGMEEQTQTLTAANSGETPAVINYEIISASILGEDLLNLNLSDDEIVNHLKTNYPFAIDFNISNNIIQARTTEMVSITVNWPYESGNDELDTYWGQRAYQYHLDNPSIQSIEIIIKITAYQQEN